MLPERTGVNVHHASDPADGPDSGPDACSVTIGLVALCSRPVARSITLTDQLGACAADVVSARTSRSPLVRRQTVLETNPCGAGVGVGDVVLEDVIAEDAALTV